MADTPEVGGELAQAVAEFFAGVALLDDPSSSKVLAVAATVTVPRVVGAVTRSFGRYSERNTRALAVERSGRRKQWAVESAARLDRELRDLATRIDGFEAQLEERTLDPQFQRLLDNFGLEATREAINERFRMLTHATAGAFNVTMSIAEASRAERVIRELDPADILVLRRFYPVERDTEHPAATEDVDPLVAAGCLSARWGAGGIARYQLTRSGGLVVRLLRSYETSL